VRVPVSQRPESTTCACEDAMIVQANDLEIKFTQDITRRCYEINRVDGETLFKKVIPTSWEGEYALRILCRSIGPLKLEPAVLVCQNHAVFRRVRGAVEIHSSRGADIHLRLKLLQRLWPTSYRSLGTLCSVWDAPIRRASTSAYPVGWLWLRQRVSGLPFSKRQI
jgi:hypothetical protein